MASDRFDLVHALRGIAASWVVLYHASEGRHIPNIKQQLPAWMDNILFNLGYNGVAIFFAISGFVIAHSLSGASVTGSYVGRFIVRRSVRLDPPYWTAIVITIALGAVSALVKHESYAYPTGPQILAHLIYMQNILQYNQIEIVFWTLCYEVQFYIFFVLVLYFRNKFHINDKIITSLLAIISLCYGLGFLKNPIDGLFLDRWHCFYLGVLAYWGRESKLAVAILMALAAALFLREANVFTLMSAGTAILLFVNYYTGYIRRGLSWKPLMFLGTISYSLYLTHNPVTGAAFFLLKKMHVPEWPALCASFMACVLAAYAIWYVVERPSMALARKIRLKPVTA